MDQSTQVNAVIHAHPRATLAFDGALPRVARQLDAFNHGRFRPGVEVAPEVRRAMDAEERVAHDLELEFLDSELERVQARAAEAPADADAFVAWFEALQGSGPGQNDRLFDWLAAHASKEALTWFLTQEIAGEAGFEDLVALTQLKMPPRVKLELARNYWDEMGQGQASAMHGPMLGRLAEGLGILEASRASTLVEWESLALANLMVGLAVHRRHAFRSIGALGVIELTAPGRASKVNEGLKRVGVAGELRRYYALHATLDIKHSESWNREILRPLVAADPSLTRPIAEGALARLEAGKRCFVRYREVLGVR
jgi:hypothetical protein